MGNHDKYFLRALTDDNFLSNYTDLFGSTFENLKETLTSEHHQYLMNLPQKFILPEHGIAAFHGSPWIPLEEYIYPDSPLERFDSLTFSTVFLGHTHHAMDVVHNHVRIINPGSAGQPRDGGWPSYCIFDTETQDLRFKRVRYDVTAFIKEIEPRVERNSYLIEVLHRIKN
jgi:predicted phosphodiesterase